MQKKKGRLFCEIHPVFFVISEQKEILKRHIKNFFSKEKIAKTIKTEKLPNVISEKAVILIKKGKTIDPVLQQNKVVNLKLACSKINGMLIRPGEVFSFWITVGKITKRKGYKEGRVLRRNKLRAGMGGGLCNLANTIHWLVLHSPLEVTEFHSHSDALDPDKGQRIPLNSGTSVAYNYIDYRFKNNTEQDIQLLIWCDEEHLRGELRSEKDIPHRFELTEEDHHFHEEDGKFYRKSKMYIITYDKQSGDAVNKELVLDNHSKVMYDYSLIPKEMIR